MNTFPTERLVRRRLRRRGQGARCWRAPSATRRWCMYRARTAASRRWKTPAGTACCRCPRAGCTATRSLRLPRPGLQRATAAAPTCRRRRRSTPRPACAAFPVVEKHRFVWVWPGDPALADPALVPDLHWNDDPDWAGDGKLIHVKCDYRLVVDNLMDLTHETFVHGSSIGQRARGRGALRRHAWRPHRDRDALDGGHRAAAVLGRPDRSTPTATRAGSTAGRSSASRRPAPSPSTSAWRRPAPARRKGRPRPPGRQRLSCSTPSRPRPTRTCHYFWAFARNYCLRRAAPDARAARRRGAHLPRGRADPRSAAAGHRRAPGPQLLQPEHRRRLDVGAAPDRRAWSRPRRRRTQRAGVDSAARRLMTTPRADHAPSSRRAVADRARAAAPARADPGRRAASPARASPSCRWWSGSARRARRSAWRWCGCRRKACSRRCPTAAMR